MRLKNGFATIAFIFAFLLSHSQDSINKAGFRSILLGGVLAGATEASGSIQWVNGATYKSYFAGIGVGVDYYFDRTVPVFFEVRKNIHLKDHTPFIYADLGHHFAWLKKEIEEFESDHKGGLFYEFGVGYNIPISKRINGLFSIGYSYKEYSMTVNTMPWISVWPSPPNSIQYYEYELRRFSIKTGITF